jgi:hypothetical protein
MEDENLRDSLWFRQLTAVHKKTCLLAARGGMFVCVPQTCSLASVVVSKRDIEHHVLKPQTARGEFLTLSGRKVIMSGTDARTDAGFKERVVAKVLSAQTVPLEIPDGKGGFMPGKLHVYHISRPLEGGIAAPSCLDELTAPAIAQYLGMLRGLPENEELFSRLSSDVAGIQRILMSKQGTALSKAALAQSKLRVAIQDAALEALESSIFDGEPSDRLDTAQRQIFMCLEAWACEKLHAPFIDVLREVKRADTAALEAALAGHAGEGIEAFEIAKKFRCDYADVVDLLVSLDSAAKTPLSKLHLLRDVCTAIVRTVERHLEAAAVDLSDVDLGADDVLSILTWVLTQAHKRGRDSGGMSAAADLPVQLAFIQRCRQPGCGPLDKSQLGYVFANIGQALGFFGANAEGPEELW